MIRHRPAGLGHPYRLEVDQRVPVQPIAGEPIELRATAPPDANRLRLELVIDGVPRRRLMSPFDPWAAPEERATTGHLAAAARGLPGRGRIPWRLHLPQQPAGTHLRYRFAADGQAPTRWFEVGVAGWQAAGGRLVLNGADATQRLVPGNAAWLVGNGGPHRVRFALRLAPDDHVVGFGERFDRLDQSGQRLDAVVFEQYQSQGHRTYLPVPFAIVIPADGSPGWGFHVRTSRRTWFDVGASDPTQLRIEVALDPAEVDPLVEVALYAGTPAEVLAAFLAETGSPALPPDWVFAPWMSGNEWNTQARVRAEVERSLAEDIPVGVVVVEAWSDETTFAAFRDVRYPVHPDGAPHRLADFSFAPDGAWPDPKGLVDWLHARGIRVLLWQAPYLRTRPQPTGQAAADRRVMVARRYAVRQADGRPYHNRAWWFPGALLPDWTNPEAAAWWVAKRRYLVDEVGIDGFKTDGGEHAWGDDLRYADGTRGDTTNNRYPVQYAAAYHRLLRACGRQPVTFSRAGFTGAARVPCHWAGDERSTWDAFRASIIAGLTAGVSGVFFWGWDLAGFSGEVPDAELYLRAAAMATFCPIMQYHSEFNHHRRPSRDRTPWNIAERIGDPRVIPTYRRYAQLRERLVPYLVDQARRTVQDSLPLMRALLFAWPHDPAVWNHPFQYLLGDDLLVAPVVEPGATSWEVYVPSGAWVDAWTGQVITGPAVLRRDAPLDTIPIYLREAAAPSLYEVFRASEPSDPAG